MIAESRNFSFFFFYCIIIKYKYNVMLFYIIYIGGVAGGRVGHKGLAAALPSRCFLVRGKKPQIKVICR